MPRRSVLAVYFATLAHLAAGESARADDTAVATELFNAGRDLMKAGDYAAACPKLVESVRLEATVGALAKLAECEEHEHRMASAYARWLQALNLARVTADARTDHVAQELARIDKAVPKIRIVTVTALPADALIRVDETAFGPATVGIPLPVDPGAHDVTVSAAGKKPWGKSVTTVEDGVTTSVVVPELEDAPAWQGPPSPPSTAATLPPLPPSRPASPWPAVAIAVGGAGAASIGAGSVLGLVALAKRNDAGCSDNVCPSASSASTLGGAKTAAAWSTGLFVAGAALCTTGIAIWLLSRGHDGSSVRVGAGTGAAVLMLTGDWR